MSSGFSQALTTLLVVAAAGAALDYHVITTHPVRPAATAVAASMPPAVSMPVAAASNRPDAPASNVEAPSLTQLLHGPKPDPVAIASLEARALNQRQLRVCADPNNLPFSNRDHEGFENALADLVAQDLGLRVTYTWWPQRRGFVRSTLESGACDVVMGMPSTSGMVTTTSPYYRSTFAFVTRRDRHLRIDNFDDPRLRNLRIGLHVVGNDYGSVPPARELATRGIIDNVRGYSIYGSYSRPNPPKELIDAVAKGDVDVAIAWGPLAGYFARREPVRLVVTPVAEVQASAGQAGGSVTTGAGGSGSRAAVGVTAIPVGAIPMSFDISMGVRHGDTALRNRLEQVLSHRKVEIVRLLEDYGVPIVAWNGSGRGDRVAASGAGSGDGVAGSGRSAAMGGADGQLGR
jgi:quinoprotein dehydrogenase-associated probable ABC transporter substrate-binding protein